MTKVQRYYDKGQIQQATDWVLSDLNQPVYIWEPNRELNSNDIHRLVRVTGRLEGEWTACGGSSRCWSLDYGHGAPAIFRSSSTLVDTGMCVSFVGPASSFEGSTQFNVENFSWLKIY